LELVDRVLLAFLGVLFISTFTHDWRYHNSQPLARLLFFFGMPAAIYWVARQMQITQRALWTLFACCGLFGIYLSLTAIAETRGWSSLVLPKYIVSSEYEEFLGRGRGPLLNPAGGGILQCICLAGALAWWPRMNRGGQAALLAVALLYALGLYYTLTRSVWMGAALAITVLLAVGLPRAWRGLILGCVLLAGTITVTTQWENLVTFKRDKNVSEKYMAESASLRPILATIAWHMFLDRPLQGCGYGQYWRESKPYLSLRVSDLPLEKARPYFQHNAFLALLTETGLIGMGLFTVLLALWWRNAWRLWKNPAAPLAMRQQGLWMMAVLAAYLPNAMFHDVSIIPMVNMALFFLAGVTEGVAANCRLLAPGSAARRDGHATAGSLGHATVCPTT
jgi:O-antigen ligase